MHMGAACDGTPMAMTNGENQEHVLATAYMFPATKEQTVTYCAQQQVVNCRKQSSVSGLSTVDHHKQ